jgi:flagellin-specific chaperone FliS
MYVLSKEVLEESKEAIIIQKLDTIFNFITESYVSNAFKKELVNYQESSEIYKDFYDEYEQTYHNMHKRELLIRKNAELYEVLETIKELMEEYKKTGEKETLKTAMLTYKEQVLPKIEHIRRLKYEVIEVLEENEVSRLVQLEVPLSKVDFSFDGELPHVIRFTKK